MVGTGAKMSIHTWISRISKRLGSGARKTFCECLVKPISLVTIPHPQIGA